MWIQRYVIVLLHTRVNQAKAMGETTRTARQGSNAGSQHAEDLTEVSFLQYCDQHHPELARDGTRRTRGPQELEGRYFDDGERRNEKEVNHVNGTMNNQIWERQ